MKDQQLTGQAIKLAFILMGSVGTILFLRWVIRPMLPLTPEYPSLLHKSFNFGLNLFAFALIIAALVSGIALISCLWDRGRG